MAKTAGRAFSVPTVAHRYGIEIPYPHLCRMTSMTCQFDQVTVGCLTVILLLNFLVTYREVDLVDLIRLHVPSLCPQRRQLRKQQASLCGNVLNPNNAFAACLFILCHALSHRLARHSPPRAANEPRSPSSSSSAAVRDAASDAFPRSANTRASSDACRRLLRSAFSSCSADNVAATGALPAAAAAAVACRSRKRGAFDTVSGTHGGGLFVLGDTRGPGCTTMGDGVPRLGRWRSRPACARLYV